MLTETDETILVGHWKEANTYDDWTDLRYWLNGAIIFCPNEKRADLIFLSAIAAERFWMAVDEQLFHNDQ